MQDPTPLVLGNPDLLRLVKELACLPPERIAEASALVENILFEWAGVRGNDPNARATVDGVNIDARKVGGNDALFGEAANDAVFEIRRMR